MKYSVALSGRLHQEACHHLIRPDGQEDLCFALWRPSEGKGRMSALVHQLILPDSNERHVHGNASFGPAYFQRALQEALQSHSGLALLHSHLGPGWQDMSSDDVIAENRYAAPTFAVTSLPFVGLTLGTDGSWSGRFWKRVGIRRYEREWCSSVRVLGDRLHITHHPELAPIPTFRTTQTRTISAWGEQTQADLMRLCVGVIGAGSVGSLVAEGLARTGIGRILLIDFDSVEEVNLDRLLHAAPQDVSLKESKVEVLARALRRSATAEKFSAEPIEWGVTEQVGFRAALDCDVLFSCVDRPWPRSVLNFIAYAHLIPVIDGGIYAERGKHGGVLHADWRTSVIGPERSCLECLGQYSSENVSAEREGFWDDPEYIRGLPETHVAKHNQNVFGFSFSLASFEFLDFLRLVVPVNGMPGPMAPTTYHFKNAALEAIATQCHSNCHYPELIAMGDRAGIVVTATHPVAERSRATRQHFRRYPMNRFRRWLWHTFRF